MKAVVVFLGFLAVALAFGTPKHYDVDFKSVDAEFVARQKKILAFFDQADQVDVKSEYYKAGYNYDVEANIENYTSKEAVQEFLFLYKLGFISVDQVFSVFDTEMRDQAIALFHLFYYAKDFETFYKTAAFARIHFHREQFFYALTIAIFQRADTQGFVIPAPYEIYPDLFSNMENIYKTRRVKMQHGIVDEKTANNLGIFKESDFYVFYANYSDYWNFENKEHKLAYFAEDIDLNSYYYYFHTYLPFWMDNKEFKVDLEGRYDERYYMFYQRILAQYYMERLSNDLGEIPDFSWYQPIETGYTPYMNYKMYPFIGRQNDYKLHTMKNYQFIRFLDTYEKSYLQFLQKGHFKAFNKEVDFHQHKAITFISDYWQGNPALYENMESETNQYAYEIISRYLLSATPEFVKQNDVAPAALMFYQTSLRDPMFYQLYSKIMKYVLMSKLYLQPYTKDDLQFEGVEIKDVTLDKLVTFFEYYDFDVTSSVYKSLEEFSETTTPKFKVRQPRLNHKHFSININVKSDKATEAVFKIFMGPKYDSNGFPITLENNWKNFVELDQFKYKLNAGENKIHRNCDDFFWYKDDSISINEIYKHLDEGKVPVSMSEDFTLMPMRLMLPKGKKGGFPVQFFVFAYPFDTSSQSTVFADTKPVNYPFDRPVQEGYFDQDNMYFKNHYIYFEGEQYPNYMNSPDYVPHEDQH